jgi:hypothetical protein
MVMGEHRRSSRLRIAAVLAIAAASVVAVTVATRSSQSPDGEEVSVAAMHGVRVADPFAAELDEGEEAPPQTGYETAPSDGDGDEEAEAEGGEEDEEEGGGPGKDAANAGHAVETTKTIVTPPESSASPASVDSVIVGTKFQGDPSFAVSTVPPDPTMAAGPNDVVVVTNQHVVVFEKDGTQVSSVTLKGFFSSIRLPSKPVYDPIALYDPYIDRFWISAQNNDHVTNGLALVALSDTSSASGSWTFFGGINLSDFNGEVHSDWCDYLRMGIDAQAVYLTCNMHLDAGGLDTAVVRFFTKQQFLDHSVTAWTNIFNINELSTGDRAITIAPAIMINADPSDGMFLVSADGQGGSGDHLSLRHITNPQLCCDGNPSTKPTVTKVSVPVGSYSEAPDAQQPNTTVRLATLGTQVRTAFWRVDALTIGQSLACSGRACLGITQLNTSSFPTVTITNDFAFGSSTADRWFPGISSSSDGWKTVVYAKSSSTIFAEVDVIAEPPANVCRDCTRGSEVTVQEGFGFWDNPDEQGRDRWGDYFTAARDPDGTHIWVHGEFAIYELGVGTEVAETVPH